MVKMRGSDTGGNVLSIGDVLDLPSLPWRGPRYQRTRRVVGFCFSTV